MNPRIKELYQMATLIAGLGLIPVGPVAAQSFTILHTFSNGSDGATPLAGLILSGNTLYGTASDVFAGYGTVFSISVDGSNFTTLYSFTNGSDGANPFAGLILSGSTLYGTTRGISGTGYGTVFAVGTNGTNFTTLHAFTNRSDGTYLGAGLVLSGSTLYGTAADGGAGGYGTVFAVSTNGTNFMTLYGFTNGNDGAYPEAGLILSGSTLYGTATGGGSAGDGTVFTVNTNGTNFATLHSFTNGSDGAHPQDGLILSGTTLYGTGGSGGTDRFGTVFSVNTNGTNYTTLYSFTNGGDGANPFAGLSLSGNTLYGTAMAGGLYVRGFRGGTVFALNTNGANFTTLYSFTGASDGDQPVAGLILAGDTLYGTVAQGGYGTVFSLSFAPQLSINLCGANVILTWPTNLDGFDYSGFNLEATASLFPPAWSTNLPAPVVVNGQFTVTNPITATQQFFQLSQ